MKLFGLGIGQWLGLGVLSVIGLAMLYGASKVDLEHLITVIGYPGLFLIVFAETGLLIGFFLPGDTLLLTTGLLCQRGFLKIGDVDGIFFVIPVLIVAAILGDAVGYQIGKRAGPRLFTREDSRWFHRDHLLKAQRFYDKHGGKTIVAARFLAFIRTFAPTVAGAGKMPYSRFAFFNISGAVLWVFSVTLAGYFVAKAIPNIEVFFTALVVGMLILSIVPAAIGLLRQRRAARRKALAETQG